MALVWAELAGPLHCPYSVRCYTPVLCVMHDIINHILGLEFGPIRTSFSTNTFQIRHFHTCITNQLHAQVSWCSVSTLRLSKGALDRSWLHRLSCGLPSILKTQRWSSYSIGCSTTSKNRVKGLQLLNKVNDSPISISSCCCDRDANQGWHGISFQPSRFSFSNWR